MTDNGGEKMTQNEISLPLVLGSVLLNIITWIIRND